MGRRVAILSASLIPALAGFGWSSGDPQAMAATSPAVTTTASTPSTIASDACDGFPQRYARALVGGKPRLTTLPLAPEGVTQCSYFDAKRRADATLLAIALDAPTSAESTPAEAFAAQIEEVTHPTKPGSRYQVELLVPNLGVEAWGTAWVAGPRNGCASVEWRDDAHVYRLVVMSRRTRWHRDPDGSLHRDLTRLVRHVARKVAAARQAER